MQLVMTGAVRRCTDYLSTSSAHPRFLTRPIANHLVKSTILDLTPAHLTIVYLMESLIDYSMCSQMERMGAVSEVSGYPRLGEPSLPKVIQGYPRLSKAFQGLLFRFIQGYEAFQAIKGYARLSNAIQGRPRPSKAR